MSFLDVLKRGAGAVARGATGAGRSLLMEKALAPTVTPEPAPAATPAPTGFELPELDPNDPDYAEKKQVHDAFIALEQHFNDNVQGVDFQKEYAKLADEQKSGKPQRREWNPFSKLAVALGTQNPNAPWESNRGLAEMEATETRRLTAEQGDFEKAMDLKKEALTGHINQLLRQGEFKKALMQSAVLQELEITRDRLKSEHEQKNLLERIREQNKGRVNVAEINAKVAADREQRRWQHAKEIAGNLKLSPTDRAQMNALIDSAKTKFHAQISRDPVTLMEPSDDEKAQADDDYRRELMSIHEHFEAREIGERPAPAEKPAATAGERPSGAAWKAAASK